MKTLKAKFILFSLLAITATTLLTSCEQSTLVDLPDPAVDEASISSRNLRTPAGTNVLTPAVCDEVIFATVLEACRGNFEEDEEGRYSVELTEADLGTAVYNAIVETGSLRLEEDVTLSAEDVQEIFCTPGTVCTLGAYTFTTTRRGFNNLSASDISIVPSPCFELLSGYWVCVNN